MANFWDDPLKPYAANKIVVKDYVSKSHPYQDKVRERFKVTASDNLMEHYTTLEATVYVFSEKELKELLKR